MLFVKIIEGLVRLIGRVPFDKSTHSIDSGLIGAMSLAGCCGAKRRSHHKHKRPRSSGGAASAGPHTSQSSVGPPSSMNRLMHNTSPPSFLRPEQALLPYKEDADDENGYIMGAWGNHTFGSQSSYQPINTESSEAPTSVTSTSGFARVGGGRAHADSPFSITPAGRGGVGSKRTSPGLPPGAMAPMRHIRNQSHHAVIEDVSTARPSRIRGDDADSSSTSSPPKKGGFWNKRWSSTPNEPFDDDEVETGPLKSSGRWFSRFMHGKSISTSTGEFDETKQTEGAKSSFVVVRGKKPSPQPPQSSGSNDATESSEVSQGTFSVIRPQRHHAVPGPSNTPAR